MKRFFSYLMFFSLVTSMSLLTSCGEDDPLGSGPDPNQPVLPPSVVLISGDNLISGDSEILPGETIDFRISLLQGDNPMKNFTIKEDGANVAADRITIDGGNTVTNNPFLLAGSAAASAEYDISITTEAKTNESRIYTIEVVDDINETAEVEFLVTVSGTPVNEITGILLNQGGPAGTGGLNLTTGMGTGSQDAEAHIKDEGIDLNASSNAENWIQRISGVNGSVIRVPGSNNAEGFSYDNVAIQEEIVTAFTNADELTDENAMGEKITAMVNIDDVFLVQNGDNYWVLKVTNVVVTTDDNADQYEFSIKQ